MRILWNGRVFQLAHPSAARAGIEESGRNCLLKVTGVPDTTNAATVIVRFNNSIFAPSAFNAMRCIAWADLGTNRLLNDKNVS